MARYDYLARKLRARKSALPPEEPKEDRPPCPEARVLRDYLGGRLPSEQEEAIGDHLLSCTECGRDILAWDTVVQEDEAIMRRSAPSRLARWARRSTASLKRGLREGLARRPAFTWATGTALAAALVAIICLTPSTEPSGVALVGDLRDTLGNVRKGYTVFSPSEQIHLELTLPRPAYVYVIVIHDGRASIAYPEGEPTKLDAGHARIPSGEEKWSQLPEGDYTMLAGTRDAPLEQTEADSIPERFADAAEPATVAAGLSGERIPRPSALSDRDRSVW